MDELASRLVTKVGVSDNEAQRAIGIIIGFLRDAGPAEKVDRVMAALPGSDRVESPFDGSFAGITGAMAAFNALKAAGLDTQQIQGTVREFVDYAKTRAGDDAVDDLVRSIPGLGQFV
jgi:hypothetical protein